MDGESRLRWGGVVESPNQLMINSHPFTRFLNSSLIVTHSILHTFGPSPQNHHNTLPLPLSLLLPLAPSSFPLPSLSFLLSSLFLLSLSLLLFPFPLSPLFFSLSPPPSLFALSPFIFSLSLPSSFFFLSFSFLSSLLFSLFSLLSSSFSLLPFFSSLPPFHFTSPFLLISQLTSFSLFFISSHPLLLLRLTSPHKIPSYLTISPPPLPTPPTHRKHPFKPLYTRKPTTLATLGHLYTKKKRRVVLKEYGNREIE